MALDKLRNKFNKTNLTVSYKLLNDLLFIEIIFFLLALIGEGILPGTITSRVGFSKILVAVGFTILAIFYTGKKSDIKPEEIKPNKKTTFLLLFILVLLIFVSLIKISIYLNLILSASIVLTGYYIYRIMFQHS